VWRTASHPYSRARYAVGVHHPGALRAGRTYGREVTDLRTPDAPADLPRTLGALRASGHEHRTVKEELRTNLVARLSSGEDPFPGVVGIEDTVRPQLERALLAGHDVVLLGERGQGKTRLLRTLIGLLDEWTPVIEGSELNEHPYEPVSVWARRTVAQHGDATAVAWLHRSQRYGEKLATPDTSVGDLIGDVDPVKVAEGRTLGDPETVHYGLVPRTNRGIFAINELPDLAERIQVSLLNVLEERDIQVRGYALRLPLDLLLVASANPEDYTNRGRIITPLKDRFGAEIRTHYPLRLADEVSLVRQEADLTAVVPHHLLEVVARFTRLVRESTAVDQRSGVSARFAVAAAESLAAGALRRAAITGEALGVARVGDLPAVVPTLRGKVEFEVSEEGREEEVLQHLMKRAVAETFRARLGGVDLAGLIARFDEGEAVEVGDLVTSDELLRRVGPVEGLGRIVTALEGDEAGESPGVAASCIETVLEGLYLTRRISKDEVPGGGRAVYGGA
jgi:magnesium chelatase subunit I